MRLNPFTVLHQLAALQTLAVAPDAEEVVGRLQTQLEGYAEFEFRSDGKRIDLITLTDDPRAVASFLAIQQDRGALQSELGTPKALVRLGAGKVVILKLPIAGPMMGGELYIRGALPPADVDSFLDRQGVAPELRERITQLAGVFGKAHTHMLGADVVHPLSITIFFTTYLRQGEDQGDGQTLRKALQHTGVSEEGIDAFLPLHRVLGETRPKTLYFSWTLTDQEPVTQAKVDYAEVRLGSVSEVMAALGLGAQRHIPIQWGSHLCLDHASYAGVIVGPTGPVAARAYFVRRLPKKRVNRKPDADLEDLHE